MIPRRRDWPEQHGDRHSVFPELSVWSACLLPSAAKHAFPFSLLSLILGFCTTLVFSISLIVAPTLAVPILVAAFSSLCSLTSVLTLTLPLTIALLLLASLHWPHPLCAHTHLDCAWTLLNTCMLSLSRSPCPLTLIQLTLTACSGLP